jgi:hypothetical protein
VGKWSRGRQTRYKVHPGNSGHGYSDRTQHTLIILHAYQKALLVTQAEFCDQCTVAFWAFLAQVGKQSPTLTD